MVFDELNINETKSNNKSKSRKSQNDESKIGKIAKNDLTSNLSKKVTNSKSPRLSANLKIKSIKSNQDKHTEEFLSDKQSSGKNSPKNRSNSHSSSVKRKLSDGLASNLHEITPVFESTVLNPMYCTELRKEKPLSEVYGNFD